MRVLLAASLAAAVCLSIGAAAGADLTAASMVDTVTVYPSGAEVARSATVKLDRGDAAIVFPDLPATAVPSSIRVEGQASGRLEIASVDSRRVFVPRADEATLATERKRLEEAIEKLKDERAALQARIDGAEAQKRLIANLAQLPIHPAPPAQGAPAPPAWSDLFELIGTRFGDAQKVVLETRIRMRESDRQIKDLEGKLAQLAPAPSERTEVKVFVTAAAALEANFVVRYAVPGASWTPFYDARLATGTKANPPKLQLVRRAAIRQRSGESWAGVALTLSTARPSAGTTAPPLEPITVDFESEAAARPEPIADATLQRQRAAPAASARFAQGSEATRSGEEAPIPLEARQAGVEAQAFQALYAIPGRVSVPATGEAKRVEIDALELDPALSARTVPKRDAKAYLYIKFTTPRGTPVLPGAVALFRDTVFVGNGQLPLLAAGEEHELGFGVLDSVRVRHAVLEEKRSETGLISTTKSDTRSYRISVKNLHERALAVTVLDQIPVSQNADIKIELLGRSAPTKRDVDDKRGLLAWDLKLEPDEEKTVEFGWRVSWPAGKNVHWSH
jgi:uncharacterized protein (TIGR02231 family)